MNSLPNPPLNRIDNGNTTTTPLGIGATFTGAWVDVSQYQEISVIICADQDSATDGLVFEWSHNGSDVCDTDVFDVYANVGTPYTPNPAARYYRITYTNGAVAQTYFLIESILRTKTTGGSFHKIHETLKDNNDGRLGVSVVKLRTAQDDYVSMASTIAGNAKMSLEEYNGDVATGSLPVLNYGNNYVSGISGIDASTESINVIDYERHEIHAGQHYFLCGVEDLSINQVLDFTFQTPDTTKWIHLNWEISPESEVAWYVYEDAVATNALANTIIPRNNNRNSLNTSGAVLKYEVQANLATANADTNVTGATLLENGIVGSGKVAGDNTRAKELILKQNTIYCLRGIANTAGYLEFCMEWYEHTDLNT